MELERIKFNNQTMVLYIVVDILKQCKRMDMIRMVVITAMLQDDAIVDLLLNTRENLNFANFRVLNKGMMVNINKRFYHTLPLMVNASSILMDAGFMTIREGNMIMLETKGKEVFAEMGCVNSIAAKRIDQALPKMLDICQEVPTKRMIKTLNIEI